MGTYSQTNFAIRYFFWGFGLDSSIKIQSQIILVNFLARPIFFAFQKAKFLDTQYKCNPYQLSTINALITKLLASNVLSRAPTRRPLQPRASLARNVKSRIILVKI